ncbi:MAG: ABC transporter substrate-binding protein [Rhodoferax sp.]|nr:ABC transporter substrate-binding protein [Rhodoferax sp.]
MRSYVEKSGAKTWNLISADYALGHSFSKKFIEMVQETGDIVQQNLFAPQGTSDYGSFISQLGKPTDGLIVTLNMSDANVFAKQQKQFGLFDKYKIVLGNGFATEFRLDTQGDSVLGVLAGLSYHYSLPGARNAQYVKAFEARNKRKSIFADGDTMVAMEMLRTAIVKANPTDVPAVRAALAGLKAPNGKTMFAMRSLEPGSALFGPPSTDCKLH